MAKMHRLECGFPDCVLMLWACWRMIRTVQEVGLPVEQELDLRTIISGPCKNYQERTDVVMEIDYEQIL